MSWPQVILSALEIIGKLIPTRKPEPEHDAAAARHGAAAGAAAHQASRAAGPGCGDCGPPRSELPTLNESESGEHRRAQLGEYSVLAQVPDGGRIHVLIAIKNTHLGQYDKTSGSGSSTEAAIRDALFRVGLTPETARRV